MAKQRLQIGFSGAWKGFRRVTPRKAQAGHADPIAMKYCYGKIPMSKLRVKRFASGDWDWPDPETTTLDQKSPFTHKVSSSHFNEYKTFVSLHFRGLASPLTQKLYTQPVINGVSSISFHSKDWERNIPLPTNHPTALTPSNSPQPPKALKISKSGSPIPGLQGSPFEATHVAQQSTEIGWFQLKGEERGSSVRQFSVKAGFANQDTFEPTPELETTTLDDLTAASRFGKQSPGTIPSHVIEIPCATVPPVVAHASVFNASPLPKGKLSASIAAGQGIGADWGCWAGEWPMRGSKFAIRDGKLGEIGIFTCRSISKPTPITLTHLNNSDINSPHLITINNYVSTHGVSAIVTEHPATQNNPSTSPGLGLSGGDGMQGKDCIGGDAGEVVSKNDKWIRTVSATAAVAVLWILMFQEFLSEDIGIQLDSRIEYPYNKLMRPLLDLFLMIWKAPAEAVKEERCGCTQVRPVVQHGILKSLRKVLAKSFRSRKNVGCVEIFQLCNVKIEGTKNITRPKINFIHENTMPYLNKCCLKGVQ
ncbi:uncharacterized protein BDR25DRAFT_351419 [Lindgomyces ingoldianus]|uniref:Uncharacterized protein n=1 Tax=Lindgomyces ingoldianus TaxID=673940 RepID=A0ACB6R817_9PLEO|nr:uncharacterized protein BDR25DRAFT_351419 [Lindgomyces ingoldianus]KAF2474938.1 hypothetical protein BDR25DRAFT_351419 [Lindgomyces ingoldianus]